MWHERLTVNLESVGIKRKLLFWLHGYVKDIVLEVVNSEICSDANSVNVGVAQVSIVGHIFFVIFIDDMRDKM